MTTKYDWENPFGDGVLAQAWCSKENAHKTMDPDLCHELTKIANRRVREMLEQGEKVTRIFDEDRETNIYIDQRILPPDKWDATGIVVCVKEGLPA